MPIDSRDYPMSDELERRLISRATRNRQIPQRRNGGPSSVQRFAAESRSFVQTLLKNMFLTKPDAGSRAS